MAILVLLLRELKLAGRRPGTWWTRVVLGAFGGLLVLAVAETSGSPTQIGRSQFIALSYVAFAAALFAGVRYTAHSLGEEIREGTLGLLFLTRLRAHDVVLGKLAATTLRAAYSLIAALPIIALPMLLGGVTFTAYGHVAAVLANTLFVSVAIGLAVSAFNRQPVRAVLGTLFLVMALAGIPFWIDAAIADYRDANFNPYASILSPGYALYLAAHTRGIGIWECLAWQHALGWLLLGLATLGTRRMTEKVNEKSRLPFIRWLLGTGETSAGRRLRDRHPVQWLTQRRGRAPTVIACLLLVTLGIWSAWYTQRMNPDTWQMMMRSTLMLYIFPFYFILTIWIAAEAARRTGDARREGALELMLATPLQVPEIVRGFWRGIVRMFGPAILIVLLLRTAAAWIHLLWYHDYVMQQLAQNSMVTGIDEWAFFHHQAASEFFGLVTTVLVPMAVAWVGLWLGLSMERPAPAIAVTWVVVVVLPVFIGLVVQIASTAITFFSQGLSNMWMSVVMQGLISLVVYAAFILWARRCLLRHFRNAANGTHRRPRSRSFNRLRPTPPPLPA
ncbi:MAG TPA: hypothetical protein DCY13_13830 [Verrucomicrobiales bacterium]|nr:hypothetical protein [Verrucomicrobiales bacterium]